MLEFASILREGAEDVDSMDTARLDQYLKDNKVDMAGPQKRFDATIPKRVDSPLENRDNTGRGQRKVRVRSSKWL